MKSHMNKNLRSLLILTVVIVVACLAAFWASSTSQFPPFPFGPRLPPRDDVRNDLELFYTVETVVSTINVTLSAFLLIIYIGIYRKTRSEFTIGLAIFSAIFLLNALASNPLVHWVFGFQSFGLGPFAMLPSLFTCVALGILLYLTFKY